MDNKYYIKKWLEGSLDEVEKAEFEKSDDFQIINKISKSLNAFKAPNYDVLSELERFQDNKARSAREIKLNWLKPLLRVAAVLILVAIGFFYFYLNADTSLATLAGEKSNLILPDSSIIDLNASTMISYKKRVWDINRQVILDGEAYFRVAKGSQFDVTTTSGTVSVLGTKFNVKNRENYFEVVCYEGLVEVKAVGENSLLNPGYSFRILEGKASTYKVGNDQNPGWISDVSTFRSAPFREVLLEMQRQYSLIIEVNNINQNQLFTGKFVHKDLNMALQAITLPFNLKYKIVDEHHVILSSSSE